MSKILIQAIISFCIQEKGILKQECVISLGNCMGTYYNKETALNQCKKEWMKQREDFK